MSTGRYQMWATYMAHLSLLCIGHEISYNTDLSISHVVLNWLPLVL